MDIVDFKRKVFTHLIAAISSTALTIAIFPGDYGDALGGENEFYLILRSSTAREIVKVDVGASVWGEYLTVARGQGGTVAAAWPVGTTIFASTIAEGYNNMLQEGTNRIIDFNPNEVLTPLHKGEKVYQSAPAGCERWWKSWDGTNPYWDIITGEACGAEQYTDIGWTYNILKDASAWSMVAEFYTEDPSQQDVTVMAADPVTGDQFAGTFNNAQIWRSIDVGANWNLVKDFSLESPAGMSINSFIYDTTNDAMYVLTFPYGRVWKSTNRGVDWTLVMDKGIPAFAFVGGTLGYDPFNDVLYAGLTDASGNYGANLYKSTDQGATWPLQIDLHIAEPFVDGIRSFTYDPTRDRMLMGTSGRAQVWTSDAGAAWVERVDFLNLETNEIDCRGLVYDVSRDIVVAATTSNGRVWSSIDGGINWLEKARLETVPPYIQAPTGLLYNPDNDWIFLPAGTHGTVMVSKDGGETWEIDKDDFNAEADLNQMAYDSVNKRSLVGTGPRAEVWHRRNS